jgi:hypothetical protein
VPWNRSGGLVQDFQVNWRFNRHVGSAWTLQTQIAWQPRLFDAVRFGPQLGLGYCWLQHPVEVLTQENGNWMTKGKSSIGLLSVPIGFTLSGLEGKRALTPYLSYQFVPQLGYNPGVPVLPNTLLSIGSKIKFQ